MDRTNKIAAVVCTQIPYFEDVGVITLQYLDMLVQKDNLQKSQFFKGLSKVIEKLPSVSIIVVTLHEGYLEWPKPLLYMVYRTRNRTPVS